MLRRWRRARLAAAPRVVLGGVFGGLTRSVAVVGNSVAYPPQRTDRPVSQFFPQVVAVHLHRVARHFLAPAVNALLALGARKRHPPPMHQRLEQREPPRRHPNLLAAMRDLVRSPINSDSS